MSHERTDAADRPGQGDGGGQSFPCSVESPKKHQTKPIWNRSKAWNRRNLGQKRPGLRGEKQSQSSEGGDEQKTEGARRPLGLAEWPAASGQ